MPPEEVVEALEGEKDNQRADNFTGDDSLVEAVVLDAIGAIVQGKAHNI